MRHIFLPDEEVPARCSFANCGAPLDRRMPRARSVEIAVSTSYLNALVECASLCPCAAIYYAFLQINEIIPTPTGLSEPSTHARLECLRSLQFETHITSLLLSTLCRSLSHSGCLVNELTRNAIAMLQISYIFCLEGLAQVAREQIRDRERMRTLEVHLDGRNHSNPTVLVEAHFERLVMSEKEAHSQLTMFYQP